MDITLIIIVAAIGWLIWTYNRFIKRKNQVMEAWSGIDVQLKRRANLIPNLIETVKGYAGHERTTLEDVTKLRTGPNASVAERSNEESKVTQTVRNLLAVAEEYPDLKANTNFLDLQSNLNGIEEQIQSARRYYNGAVRRWNTLIESFPSNLIARIFKFALAEYFEIELATERAVPKVDF